MGGLLGHAFRFGAADDVLAVGEGIETMLSLRCALPATPVAAALSANHLAALLLPPMLRRLYIARDADAAGDMALAAFDHRARSTAYRMGVARFPVMKNLTSSTSRSHRSTRGSCANCTRAASSPPSVTPC